MTHLRLILLSTLVFGHLQPGWSQTGEEDYRVFGEHPRLFLQTRRLRLLEREKQRQSPRWEQFRALLTGKAQMPEPGFALALYASISGEDSYCREAVRWALGPQADLRQTALVYDWCHPQISEEVSRTLASNLQRGMAVARGRGSVATARDRVLAAIALAGHRQEASEQELRLVIAKWWRGEVVPALNGTGEPVGREDILALFELLHAVRDNLNLDLRDPVRDYFRDLPESLLLTYYPAPYLASDSAYYIPISKLLGEPDLRRAALARAGDFCLVAYDPNTQPSQFLQGWLMRDTLLMRSPLGIPYELLWANPYLPGLSPYHASTYFHDQRLGRLYVRSDWDDDANWLSYRDKEFQIYGDGGLRTAGLKPGSKPIRLGEVAVTPVTGSGSVKVDGAGVGQVFLVGLRPDAGYELKVGDEKVILETADPGGIIRLPVKQAGEFVIRIRERRQ